MYRSHMKPVRVAMIVAGGILLIVPTRAHAYIDPGSSSLLLQLVIGGVAGIATVCKLYWGRIKTFFSGNKSQDK